VSSYLSVLPDALLGNTRIIIHTIQRTVTVAVAIRVFAPEYLGFVCFRASPETEKKRRVRGKNGETEGKEILFVRSYANLDSHSSSQEGGRRSS